MANAAAVKVEAETEQAVDRILRAIGEKLRQSVPKITAASHDSGQPSSIALKVALKPDKDLPDVWHVEIAERLSLASTPIDATARIEVAGRHGPQLSLMAYFDEG